MENDDFFDLPNVRCYCKNVIGDKYEPFIALITGRYQIPLDLPTGLPLSEIEALIEDAIRMISITNADVLHSRMRIAGIDGGNTVQQQIQYIKERLAENGLPTDLGELKSLLRSVKARQILDTKGRLTREEAFDYLNVTSPCCRTRLYNPGRLAYGSMVDIADDKVSKKPVRRTIEKPAVASTSAATPTVVLNIPIYRKTLEGGQRVPPSVLKERARKRQQLTAEEQASAQRADATGAPRGTIVDI